MTTEAKVGAFVLASLLILTSTIVYLANAQFRGGKVPYRTYLHYAGGLEAGSVTLDVCRNVVDRSVLVSEDETLSAMRLLRDKKGWFVEGAAGVAVAAFIKEAKRYRGKTVAVVICGGNLSEKVRARLEGDDAT